MGSIDLFHRRENRGYGELPLGAERDLQLIECLDRVLDEQGFEVVREMMTADHEPVVVLLAERLASLAVREGNVSLLVLGLRALCLAGMDHGSREALLVLPLIYRSAELLGESPVDISVAAESLVDDSCSTALTRYRRSAEKDIAQMGYQEGSDEGGFRFVRTW